MKHTLSILLSVLGLGSCATTLSPEALAIQQEQAARPVLCQGADDCEVKWGRAVRWVLDNSAYRIQVQTADIIQTAGPLPNDPRSAYVVSRVALGGGRFQFEIRSGCDNMFGCFPTDLEARAGFSTAVLGQ